ncbi:DUF3488 domain-containing transglutaminase family protein [Streptomyces sp. HNM0574]|nr:DUF3488 and transglutaminase-like domain-containing protein [Streptomyces sp. HNM0574]NLU67639.1 DUF3488 domain-containing transglutaminase family protein [Streptomyces sp. HNM0574]
MATLASACALLPLADPAWWLLQAAALVVVQAGAGVALRRASAPPPVVPLVQAVLSLLLLTVLFARDAAVAGLLPGPDALAEFSSLLAQGGQDVGRFAIPAPATDGIRLMLVGGVLLIGLLVDVLAVTFRSAAPAGLPLLALYSVAAGLGRHDGTRWLWFLCAAVGYLLLLLAEGRERTAGWGQFFAAPRDAAPHSPPPGGPWRRTGRGPGTAPLRTGQRIGVLTLGIALAVPAVLPSLGDGLLGPPGESSGKQQDGGTVSAVNPLVALQDSLNQPADRTALTYTTDAEDTREMYLRIVALDRFDGSAWKPSERRIDSVPSPLPPAPGLARDVERRKVRSTVVTADWYAQNWLPLPYPATDVRIGGRWRFEPEGRTLVGDRGQTTRGARYQVESLQVSPTAEQLREAPEPPRQLREEYTRVPESLPSVVRERALQVTRGARDDYERAVKLQDWFTTEGGFTYDTQVRAGSGSAAIVNFLEQKEGFCVHFAFSMAAMARTLDIPARVAVGFTPGTARGDGTMDVGLKDAHAWPELYFEGVGWTRFEPTPTRGTTPEYAAPQLPDPGDTPQEQLPDRDSASDPAPEPEQPDTCASDDSTDPSCGQAASGGGGDSGFPLGSVLAGSGAVLLVTGGALLPMLWRRRARTRRLRRAASAPPGPGEAATGAVLAAWRELLDTGWDHGVAPDGSATPRAAADRLVRVGELAPGPAEAVHRVALAVEQTLYAPHPRPAPGIADDVRLAHAGLRAAAPRRLRVRAVLLPNSAVRLLWSAAGHWARAGDRASSALAACAAKLRRATNRHPRENT